MAFVPARLVSLASLALGMIWLYAGITKAASPMQFADSVASFQILPPSLIQSFALSLPWLEILMGTFLVLGIFQTYKPSVAPLVRMGLLGSSLLLILFAAAISWSLARGIQIDCGCFGASRLSSTARTWLALVRDGVLCSIALVAYYYSIITTSFEIQSRAVQV